MSILEHTYVTVYYACGCVKLRAVRSDDWLTLEAVNTQGNMNWPDNCALCDAISSSKTLAHYEQQRVEREAQVRYMVDGHSMIIYQDEKGYWRGKRYQFGQKISKYYGKTDPRPVLEEAQA